MSIKMRTKSTLAAKLSTVMPATNTTFISGFALAEPTYPPEGSAPEVEAIESDGGLVNPSFNPAESAALPSPTNMQPPYARVASFLNAYSLILPINYMLSRIVFCSRGRLL